MNTNIITLISLAILLFSAHGTSIASDLDKEKRWSEQIVDSLMVGDAQTLKAGGNEFLSLYAEATEGPGDRAVIILHGMGAHPNWPEVIQPLRSELPDYGWATLSVQMPILANEAVLADYMPVLAEAPARIQAAIAFLKDKKMTTIVVIGHSLGAAMGASFLNDPGSKDVQAFIGVGMPQSELDDKLNMTATLEKLSMPVLDLYGSRDEMARDTAPKRKASARKAENSLYRQTEIEGADHFFNGMQDDLVRVTRGWLYGLFERDKR